MWSLITLILKIYTFSQVLHIELFGQPYPYFWQHFDIVSNYQKCYLRIVQEISPHFHHTFCIHKTYPVTKSIDLDYFDKPDVPRPWSFASVHRLIELAHKMLLALCNEPLWLLYMDAFFKTSIKECCLDIHLPNR